MKVTERSARGPFRRAVPALVALAISLSISVLPAAAASGWQAKKKSGPSKSAKKSAPPPTVRRYNDLARDVSPARPWFARPLIARMDTVTVVALAGGAYASADGGATWSHRGALPQEEGKPCAAVALALESADRWRMILRDGRVVATADGGATWSAASNLAEAAGEAVCEVTEGFLGSPSGGWASIRLAQPDRSALLEEGPDGWRLVAELPGRSAVASRDEAGWSAVVDNRVFRAPDAGSEPKPVAMLEGARVNGLEFADPRWGWIAADNGMVIETRDGGHTWLARPVAPGLVFEWVSFPTDALGLAIAVESASGRRGVLLTSRDRGATWQRVATGTHPLSRPLVVEGGAIRVVDGRGAVLAPGSSASWRQIGSISGGAIAAASVAREVKPASKSEKGPSAKSERPSPSKGDKRRKKN